MLGCLRQEKRTQEEYDFFTEVKGPLTLLLLTTAVRAIFSDSAVMMPREEGRLDEFCTALLQYAAMFILLVRIAMFADHSLAQRQVVTPCLG